MATDSRAIMPKADQPRVDTKNLQKLDSGPRLTYGRQPTTKAPSRGIRDYTRR